MPVEITDGHKYGCKTVPVVEDNPVMRNRIATAFLSDGFKTCVEADNAEEGIAAAVRTKPDVTILDLSLPLMNGLETATELRKLFPNTPIILLTLYSNGELETVAAKAGIDLVLTKTAPPFRARRKSA